MSKSWTKRSGWIAAGLMVVGILVIALLPQPVEVEVASVTRSVFEQVVEEDGKTRVRERYTVTAPIEGMLERIPLKAGAPVEKEMLLAIIHPKLPALLDTRTEQELEARLGAAEATKQHARAVVERARAAVKQAKADYQRTQALAEGELVAPARRERDELTLRFAERDLQAVEFELQAAGHQVDLARAALLQAQQAQQTAGTIRHWEIRSPIVGAVLRVWQESEGVVTVGTPLLELGNLAELEVVVDVLTTDAVQIQSGALVWLERWGGGTAVEGRVRLVEPSAFTKVSALGVEEQRVNIIIDVMTSSDGWKDVGDGYRVDARIVVFRGEGVLTVPTGALFRDGDTWATFVLRDGRVSKRALHIGRRNGLEAVVEQGLEAGEQVVVYPSTLVQDGVRVTVRAAS